MACNGDIFNLHKMGDMINTAIEVSEVSKELDRDISDTETNFPDGLQTDKEHNCDEELQKTFRRKYRWKIRGTCTMYVSQSSHS